MKTKNKILIIICSALLLLALIGLGIFLFVMNLPSEKSENVKEAQALNQKDSILLMMKNVNSFFDAVEGSYERSEGTEDHMVIMEEGEFKQNNFKQQSIAITTLNDFDGTPVTLRTTIFDNGNLNEYVEYLNSDLNSPQKEVTQSNSSIENIGITYLTNPSLIPHSFLTDTNEWEIKETIDYLGRKAYRILGEGAPPVNSNIGTFEIIVDKDTGIVLYLEIHNGRPENLGQQQIVKLTKVNIITDSKDSPRYTDSSILDDQSILEIENKEDYTVYSFQ